MIATPDLARMRRTLVLSLACAIASPDLPAQEPSSITSLRAKQAAARHDSTRFRSPTGDQVDPHYLPDPNPIRRHTNVRN